MQILTLLAFLSDRGAYAKEENMKTYIKEQFGNSKHTSKIDISPSIPTEQDPRKRRAS